MAAEPVESPTGFSALHDLPSHSDKNRDKEIERFRKFGDSFNLIISRASMKPRPQVSDIVAGSILFLVFQKLRHLNVVNSTQENHGNY